MKHKTHLPLLAGISAVTGKDEFVIDRPSNLMMDQDRSHQSEDKRKAAQLKRDRKNKKRAAQLKRR